MPTSPTCSSVMAGLPDARIACSACSQASQAGEARLVRNDAERKHTSPRRLAKNK